MLAGPEEVVRRRERTRGVPEDGGSTQDRRELLVCFLSLPEERVVLFLQAAAAGESCLLQRCNVDVESLQLTVDDGGFSGLIDLLEVVREARTHCSDVPGCQSQRWRLCFLDVAWCSDYSPCFSFWPTLQAPIEVSGLWRASTLLAGGCPA